VSFIRLVPKDESLPSIPTQSLQRFATTFGKFDHSIQAYLLDVWKPSSTNPKSSETKDAMEKVEENYMGSARPDHLALKVQTYGMAGAIALPKQTSMEAATLAFQANLDHSYRRNPSLSESRKRTLDIAYGGFEISEILVGEKDRSAKRQRL
jgi:hypothetical protein